MLRFCIYRNSLISIIIIITWIISECFILHVRTIIHRTNLLLQFTVYIPRANRLVLRTVYTYTYLIVHTIKYSDSLFRFYFYFSKIQIFKNIFIQFNHIKIQNSRTQIFKFQKQNSKFSEYIHRMIARSLCRNWNAIIILSFYNINKF